MWRRCGDLPEACDDGNLVSGDGCEADCTPAPVRQRHRRCRRGMRRRQSQPVRWLHQQLRHMRQRDRRRRPRSATTATPTRPTAAPTPAPAAATAASHRRRAATTATSSNGDGCEDYCAQPGCGNGVVEGEEDCDEGGICIGGAGAGTPCTGSGTCPGGTCTTFGGDGCAANCTTESDVVFDLVPGVVQPGSTIAPATSVTVLHGDNLDDFFAPQRRPEADHREGDGRPHSAGDQSRSGAVCPAPIFLHRLLCSRAVAAKTCGGTVFEPDGVTPSLDCTSGFTGSDNVCQGQNPCAFLHGPGNSASGVIGCDSLDGVNVSLIEDAGGSSGNRKPSRITLSGTGDAGSAVLLASTAIGGGFCQYFGICRERRRTGASQRRSPCRLQQIKRIHLRCGRPILHGR